MCLRISSKKNKRSWTTFLGSLHVPSRESSWRRVWRVLRLSYQEQKIWKRHLIVFYPIRGGLSRLFLVWNLTEWRAKDAGEYSFMPSCRQYCF